MRKLILMLSTYGKTAEEIKNETIYILRAKGILASDPNEKNIETSIKEKADLSDYKSHEGESRQTF